MDLMQAFWLALIQGITEFLPISSSAHLVLPSQLLGWPDQGLAFDVAVHVGSLLAVLLYFRREVGELTVAGLQSFTGRRDEQTHLAWAVVVGTIPAGLAGLLGGDWIEANLRSVTVIASTTLLFGALLWYADRYAHQGSLLRISWTAVVVIGLAQALALVPGTSRSGITMTAALLVGLSRTDAARFSFLLSIPLILAAGGLKALEVWQQDLHSGQLEPMLVGIVVSAVTAYVCIHTFLQIVEKMGFMPFVIYRLLLGGALFALLGLGWL